MQIASQQPQQLYQIALQALQKGDTQSAIQHFQTLITQGKADTSVFLGLAVAFHTQKDISNSFEALDWALDLEPNNLTALIMKGDMLLATDQKRLATQCYGLAVGLAENTPDLPQDLVQAIVRVRASRDAINQEIEQHLLSLIKSQGYDRATSSQRFSLSLDLMNGSKRLYPQKPRAYHFPELPVKQFYNASDFNWTADLEAATADIRQELLAILEDGEGLEPYIRSEDQGPTGNVNPLLDKADWSAFFLIKNGKPIDENIERCPKTLQALKNVPLPDTKGRAPMVLFSVLKPGTKIAPHHGFLNTRLICHLPLVVPPKCGLRVGNQVHEWQPGKLVIFDDSIEHEAWNDSEHTRVVLIFDIWRPELSLEERGLVSSLLEAVDSY